MGLHHTGRAWHVVSTLAAAYSPMDSSFLNHCVASYWSLGSLPYSPATRAGSSSSCCGRWARQQGGRGRCGASCCPCNKRQAAAHLVGRACCASGAVLHGIARPHIDLALLLQVLIALCLSQLNDVILPFAAGIIRIDALLEVLLPRHAARPHGHVGALGQRQPS